MAVSGIVVTLSDDRGLAKAALESLSTDPRLTLGERFDRRLAAVAETPSVRDDRDLWDDLNALPGVVRVDVTFVALDEPASPDAPVSLNQPGPSR
ncbi:MAG: hypothetical protein U0638_16350 [Phycisphaerales bacterium]